MVVEARNDQTITVRSPYDIVLARMRVRQLARTTGLAIREQACIALATSSLAQALRLGQPAEGRIDIHCSGEGETASVRVVCTVSGGMDYDLAPGAFADVRWMVDNLTVEEAPLNRVQVTMVKWATSGGSYAQERGETRGG